MRRSDEIKQFVEVGKGWLNDKEIEEGKMWYQYWYMMCDKLGKEGKRMLMVEEDEDEEGEYGYGGGGRGGGRGRGGRMSGQGYEYEEEDEYLDGEGEEERMDRYEGMYERRI